jgi:ABC-type molybdate transport system substrate-binding protein
VPANVVSYEDNVKAVVTKVSLGEADAGICYTTDVTADVASLAGTLEIPDALNTIAKYPIAPIVDSTHPDLVRPLLTWFYLRMDRPSWQNMVLPRLPSKLLQQV